MMILTTRSSIYLRHLSFIPSLVTPLSNRADNIVLGTRHGCPISTHDEHDGRQTNDHVAHRRSRFIRISKERPLPWELQRAQQKRVGLAQSTKSNFDFLLRGFGKFGS
jgi:hypothetical protein